MSKVLSFDSQHVTKLNGFIGVSVVVEWHRHELSLVPVATLVGMMAIQASDALDFSCTRQACLWGNRTIML